MLIAIIIASIVFLSQAQERDFTYVLILSSFNLRYSYEMNSIIVYIL